MTSIFSVTNINFSKSSAFSKSFDRTKLTLKYASMYVSKFQYQNEHHCLSFHKCYKILTAHCKWIPKSEWLRPLFLDFLFSFLCCKPLGRLWSKKIIIIYQLISIRCVYCYCIIEILMIWFSLVSIADRTISKY